MEDPVQFTLLENGLDFVWSAVEHLSGAASKRELKYALLHLVSGIELILKERLRREDWRLLFPKPDLATDVKYQSGDFLGVNFETLIERVEDICYPGFSDAELLALKTIKRRRNRFEHFVADDSAEAVISSAVVALGIILDFIRKELSADASELNGHEEELLSNIRGKLADLTAFVDARKESIAAALSEAYAVLPCPACQQNALTVDGGVECLFCGYKASADTAADDYVRNVLGLDRFRLEKDGGEWPIGFCPDCDWLACVHAKLDGYLCFGCGAQWQAGDLAKCGRCGRLIDSEKNDIPVCDSCFYEVTGRDD